MGLLSDFTYSAAVLAELDQRGGHLGFPSDRLMEQAGEATFRAVMRKRPNSRKWLICAGRGNNGGDGYVVARKALLAGLDVEVLALGDPKPGGAAAAAATAYRVAGGEVVDVDGANWSCDVVVDALFGIGLDRPIQGAAMEVARKINATGAFVVSVDIPSGLNANTGWAEGIAIRADVTVTFIGLKLGLFTAMGPGLVGKLEYESLGVPDAVAEGLVPNAALIGAKDLRMVFPKRERVAHKGRYGHAVVVGGELGYGGATCLASAAALRCGSGLVSVLTRGEHVSAVLARQPEAMVHACDDGVVPAELLDRSTAVAIGPGLGKGWWGQKLWEHLRSVARPLVVDADGLNLLADTTFKRDNWILTPHPGEAARLLGTSVAEVEQDRPRTLRALVERYGASVVLKGSGSLVLSPGELTPWLCTRGNPGMASGGTGDALTGVIVSLLAQGFDAALAARIGTYLHATAGDAAAADGERGMLASDLVAELRALVNPD